jgi:hypothetical protein
MRTMIKEKFNQTSVSGKVCCYEDEEKRENQIKV